MVKDMTNTINPIDGLGAVEILALYQNTADCELSEQEIAVAKEVLEGCMAHDGVTIRDTLNSLSLVPALNGFVVIIAKAFLPGSNGSEYCSSLKVGKEGEI